MTNWPELITPFYRTLIDWSDPNDPLKKMVCFDPAENIKRVGDLSDPVGDQAHQVAPGLIHLYPGTALILTTAICPQHCRFCFRRDRQLTPPDWSKIYVYLKKHREISEIVFSGGDPLTLSSASWFVILKKLAPLSHLKTYRLYSRLPVVNPQTLKSSFFKLWPQDKNLSLVVHLNHPREITPEFLKLLAEFKQHGWFILSQTVLLKGINDNFDTLKELFSVLWQHGIKPYYLYHLDLAPGTGHFRLSIFQGLKLFKSLRGHLPGPAMPLYVLDLPGGFGKVPVSWLKKISPKTYQVANFQGKTATYFDRA